MTDTAPRAGEREDATPEPASGERAPDDDDARLVEELIADAMRPYAAFFLLHKDGAKAKLLARLAALTAEGAQLRKALERIEAITSKALPLDAMQHEEAVIQCLDTAVGALPIPETKREA